MVQPDEGKCTIFPRIGGTFPEYEALGFCVICLRQKYCSASVMKVKQVCFHYSRFLRIFGFATYTVAPRQSNLNKFICSALGFCVYLHRNQYMVLINIVLS